MKKTRMVKKLRPKPRAARSAPPRQMQFNQQAELQIPQHVGAMAPMAPMAPMEAASQLSGPTPYKGPAISEIEEIVKDTALSLIGVENLDNDEPLMDAGAWDW